MSFRVAFIIFCSAHEEMSKMNTQSYSERFKSVLERLLRAGKRER